MRGQLSFMDNTIVNKTQRDIAEDHIHRKRKTYRQIFY